MGLPSVDICADARFGYDGGRHGHMTCGAGNAELRARDLLLAAGALQRCRVMVRDVRENGVVGLLPPVKRGGGGTIQGMSPSGPLYCTLPVQCEILVRGAVPTPCVEVEGAVWRTFEKSYGANLGDPEAVWTADVQVSIRS